MHRAPAAGRAPRGVTSEPKSGSDSPLCPRKIGGARQACPFVQLALDPALLLPQECLDLAPRRAQRRGHGKAVGVDGDADGAPAAAHEAVIDAAPAEARSGKRLLLLFYPFLSHCVEDLGIAVRALDRRTDAHGHGARMLDEGVARPDPAGVVRDRHDRGAARRGEPRAAELVGAPLRPAPRACPREKPRPRSPARGARVRAGRCCAAPRRRASGRSRSGSSARVPSRRTGSREARASARAPAAERSAGRRASPRPTGAWTG